jgi:type III restriction enzyme
MKFTLNDYQADAVGQLLGELEKARTLWHADQPKETSVALTAPTGAGKTVMAAATIEALFFGSDDFGFAPDPSAVVIWFSDSPNLNDQSRYRLMEASEKLSPTNLVTIKPPFSLRQLEAGKVYFLNTQRLSKTSKLVRGYEPTGQEMGGFDAIAPDDLAYNLWETIGNTIADEELTLYFVLDEAHRGFNQKKDNARDTLVKQLVSGTNTGHVMPVILGISATIERFKKAMEAASNQGERTELLDVIVEPRRVQESGLLKDKVILEIPNEPGNFSAVLVSEAAKRLRESTVRWKKYGVREKMVEPVRPLMVLQLPNTPDNGEVGTWLDAIRTEIPEIQGHSVRHVLSEGGVETFGQWEVDWIEPQRVQQSTEVTILLAKEAISTGWDCPRAEVLISARTAQDQTHIAQLLGRMVRSPLARRIPGDDSLNTVECILPFFDKTTAGKVVRYITGESDELTPMGGVKVIIRKCLVVPNPSVSENVWKVFDALPTQAAPRRGVKPIKRLVALAQALASDGLEESALAQVADATHSQLGALSTSAPKELDSAIREIRTVRLQQLIKQFGASGIEYRERSVVADDRAIQVGFEEAKRVFGADIAHSYVLDLIKGDDDDDGLRDAYVKVAALATMPLVSEAVDAFADAHAADWFLRHKDAISALTDERQQEYEDIRSLATEPQLGNLRRPSNGIEDYVQTDAAGAQSDAQLVDKHLLADVNQKFPVGGLNEWEKETVLREVVRDVVVGWYRNPSHRGADAFAVPYRDRFGEWRSLHPDFIVFEKVEGDIVPSIVDPHATNLEDGRFKLVGLANFAERFGDRFHRIHATIKYNNKWLALDMQDPAVRDKVRGFDGDVMDLYKSDTAIDIT